MAKKFVKVTGLNKVFDSISATGAATIKASVSATADENSILYITATADDVTTFGAHYQANSHWIWAKGVVFGSNPEIDSYLSSNTSTAGELAIGDSVQTAILKLYRMVKEAASGVQSLTTSDDSWIIIDPDLDASTGAVHLNVSHGLPSTSVSTGVVANSSLVADWGGTATVTIPNVSIDARGHVNGLTTSTVNVVTLPAKPVTSITSSGDGEVLLTTNTNATGDVTLAASHAVHAAVKAGETANKELTSDASSFKVLEVSTNGSGHVISATERTITLPATAFTDEDTTYTFANGTQSFTVTPKGGSAQTVTVAHMAKETGTATATDGTYISAVTVDDYGHVTATASSTNGVYSNDAASHADGELAVWSAATNELKTSDKTIRGTAIAADSSATTIPTTSQVIDYVQANKVSGAMTYKGTKATYAEIEALTDQKKGDVWVLSADDATSGYQKGDMFIWNGTSWDRIPAGDAKVTDLHPTLNFGTKDISVGTIDGITLHVDMPAETALNVSLDTTGTAGLTYVSSVVKGTNSHDLTVTTSTIQDGTASQKGVVKLVDSSTSTSTTEAVTPNALNDVNTLAKSKSTVSYSQSVAATEDASYLIGVITIDGTNTSIYGHDKDTVYVHPAAPTTGSDATSTTGAASATTVITGVTVDASGHVAGVATSDISAAYNQRAVAVNGTTKIDSTSTTTLDISAGSNVTVEYSDNKVVISAANNTDEKVKATTSSDKVYLLGQTESQVGNASTAEYNTAVYAQDGSLYATALYEGTKSIHESFESDWGTI